MAGDTSDNYFSLDDILATQEKLPSKLAMPIHRLGYLDPSSDCADLPVGTKMELPFWMARSLCSRKRHIASVDMPKQYREGYREILLADANVVDLHKLGPYFYSFGSQLLNFDHPEVTDIAKALLKVSKGRFLHGRIGGDLTFQARFRKIMDCSQNALNEDNSQLTEKLDETEKLLFFAGQRGLNDFIRWEKRETEKLRTSAMVQNHRKRKRAIMERS